MYDGREALPDDHKFRGQRGRVRARYRRPQLGRGSEKIGETSQRKTNLQLASGAFSCKVAPFTPAGEPRRKLHRAVDAQVATANSIPWSSTAKFSRNGVLAAPLRVSYARFVRRAPAIPSASFVRVPDDPLRDLTQHSLNAHEVLPPGEMFALQRLKLPPSPYNPSPPPM